MSRDLMNTGLAGTGVVGTGTNSGSVPSFGMTMEQISQIQDPYQRMQAESLFKSMQPQEGVMGTGMSGGDLGKIGLGVGQLGLGLASYLDQSKTNKMNRNLMQQQYDTNTESLANKRTADANLMKAFRG